MDPDVVDTIEGFSTMAIATFDVIKSGISIFMTPPLVFFVVLGFAAAAISVVRRIIPQKKAK